MTPHPSRFDLVKAPAAVYPLPQERGVARNWWVGPRFVPGAQGKSTDLAEQVRATRLFVPRFHLSRVARAACPDTSVFRPCEVMAKMAMPQYVPALPSCPFRKRMGWAANYSNPACVSLTAQYAAVVPH